MLMRRRGETLTVLSSILWGSSFAAIKVGLQYTGVYWFLLERFLAASALSLFFLGLWKRLDISLYRRRDIWILGVLNAAGFILQYLALSLTTPGKTALLVDLNVIPVAILSAHYFKEKFGGGKLLAIVVGGVGLFLVTTHADLSQLGGGQSIGDLLAFGAGLVWSFYIIRIRQMLTREEVSTIQLAVAILASTTVFLVPPTFLLEGNFANTPISGSLALYIGLFCTAVPLVLWSEGLRELSATVSSLVLLLEILFAFAFSVPLGLESFGPLDAVGGAMILLSIYLATVSRHAR